MDTPHANYQTALEAMALDGSEEQFLQHPMSVLMTYGITEAEVDAAAQADASPPIQKRGAPSAVSASLEWWGVQLAFDEPTTKKLEGGGAIAGGVGAAVAAALAPLPVAGPALALIAGLIVGGLATEAGAITMADRGKGVHLNWTWPQISVLLIPGANTASIMSMLIPYPN